MDKKELRKLYLENRMQLSKNELDKKTRDILNLFLNSFEFRGKKICCFLPINSKNEINTFKLLELSDKLDFEFCATKWDSRTNELKIFKINSSSKLIISSFDIPEPSTIEKEISKEEIDIVLIPLLIVDKNGHRVGYGKGVYDNFLTSFNRNKVFFIGLSLFDMIDKIEDLNSNDIKLTHCITPQKVITF